MQSDSAEMTLIGYRMKVTRNITIGRIDKMTMPVKKARTIRGKCCICGRWVGKGDLYTSDGPGGYGDLVGLVHLDCLKKKVEVIK